VGAKISLVDEEVAVLMAGFIKAETEIQMDIFL